MADEVGKLEAVEVIGMWQLFTTACPCPCGKKDPIEVQMKLKARSRVESTGTTGRHLDRIGSCTIPDEAI